MTQAMTTSTLPTLFILSALLWNISNVDITVALGYTPGFSLSVLPRHPHRHRHHGVRIRLLDIRSSSWIHMECCRTIHDECDTNDISTKKPPSTSSSLPSVSAVLATTVCCLFCTFGGGGGFSTLTPTVPVASAAATTTTSSYSDLSKILNHNYNDPLHQQCTRRIDVDRRDPTIFHYKGTRVDDNNESGVLRGCTPKEVRDYGGLKHGSFDGKIIIDDLTSDVKLDAGDGIHVGVWEPATSLSISSSSSSPDQKPKQEKYSDVDGIRWNDGNKWIVQKKPIVKSVGEVIFLAYIGFSTLAGFKGVYDAIQRKRK